MILTIVPQPVWVVVADMQCSQVVAVQQDGLGVLDVGADSVLAV
jgi:hypothetical protein